MNERGQLAWKKASRPEEVDNGEETEDMSDDEEEDSEYIVDGIEYAKHWDEDEKAWMESIEQKNMWKDRRASKMEVAGFDSDDDDALFTGTRDCV